MTEQFDYYKFLNDCIYDFASKGDLILNDICSEDDFETFLGLACFWTSFYKEPFPIDISNLNFNKKSTNKNKIKRKEKGQFFTPKYIVEYIVNGTIGELVKKIKEQEISEKEKLQKIFDLKICDPAMGAGIFLVAVHDFLVDACLDIIKDKNKIADISSACLKCIYGVDTDPKAVELAKISLQLNHAKQCLRFQELGMFDFKDEFKEISKDKIIRCP
jgi:hypothetical protein